MMKDREEKLLRVFILISEGLRDYDLNKLEEAHRLSDSFFASYNWDRILIDIINGTKSLIEMIDESDKEISHLERQNQALTRNAKDFAKRANFPRQYGR